jgi:hypothetical protein
MLNHSETMSEAILSKGGVWPLLRGQEMRDIFAYIKAVSGIKRATVQAALHPQATEDSLINGATTPKPEEPGSKPLDRSGTTGAPTVPPRPESGAETGRKPESPIAGHHSSSDGVDDIYVLRTTTK